MNRFVFAALAAVILSLAFTTIYAKRGEALGKYEEPEYRLIKRHDDYELREYSRRVVAEVKVKAEMNQSLNEGFRILAAYIFGKNIGNDKISMTAPVAQRASEKIGMTAPVAAREQADAWTITFFMPSKYTLDSLPQPKDERITIRELPAETMAVKKFSGSWSRANFDKNRQRLTAHLMGDGIEIAGPPIDARYNPPFTLPFMRRNEIMIPVSVETEKTAESTADKADASTRGDGDR